LKFSGTEQELREELIGAFEDVRETKIEQATQDVQADRKPRAADTMDLARERMGPNGPEQPVDGGSEDARVEQAQSTEVRAGTSDNIDEVHRPIATSQPSRVVTLQANPTEYPTSSQPSLVVTPQGDREVRPTSTSHSPLLSRPDSEHGDSLFVPEGGDEFDSRLPPREVLDRACKRLCTSRRTPQDQLGE
jgi:hypothetical protein